MPFFINTDMKYFELLREYNESRLINDFGQKLVARYESEFHKKLTPEQIITKIASYDHTPTKELTMWCCSRYTKKVNDEYCIARFEDIGSRAMPALEEYKRLLRKPHLTPPLQIKDVNQIKTLVQLEDILDIYHTKESITDSPEVKARTKQFIDSKQAEVIYNDAHLSVIVPLTEPASQFFGRGTRWCTAAKNDCAFNQYNGRGKLYIITIKDTNKKFQFHFAGNQFMNDQDRAISPNALAKKYPVLWKIFTPIAEAWHSMACNAHPSDDTKIQAISDHRPSRAVIRTTSDKIFIAAINRVRDFRVEDILNNMIEAGVKPSEKVQLAAVKRDGHALRAIIDGKINPSEKVQLAAVDESGWALNAILKAKIKPSEEVLIAAVKTSPEVMRSIVDYRIPLSKELIATAREKGFVI